MTNFTEQEYALTATAKRRIAQDLIEKLCYIVVDYDTELKLTDNECDTDIRRRPTRPQKKISSPSVPNVSVARKCFFQPSVIGNVVSQIHDTSLQYFMKGDVATRKELSAIVVLSVGTTMFEGFLGTHDEGIDGVGSIHGEIQVATSTRYGLEDLSCPPSAFSGF